MRNLIIMRHGKAERGEGKPDFERALEPRGWEEAGSVGEQLAAQGLIPDAILCSAARRTRETLAAILSYVGGDCTINLRTSLYSAEMTEMKDAMRVTPGRCVLLIGHNPYAHSLALHFAGTEERRVGYSFPTSTAAVFSMGFALDTVRFDRLVVPRKSARSEIAGTLED